MLPLLIDDGIIRPMFMLTCCAAMLECGIAWDKLSLAAQPFYVAWHESRCTKDRPSATAIQVRFDDFAQHDKQ